MAAVIVASTVGGGVELLTRVAYLGRLRSTWETGVVSDDHAHIIETISVSVDVVETQPIVLRETDQRRLVFLPTLVDRPDPLRGSFVWQRKRKDDKWEDIRAESFTSMRSGEGWVLELHSEEMTALLDGLLARRALFEKHGIRWGPRSFVDTDSLPDLVRTVIESPDSELAEVLGDLDAEQVLALGRRVDLSQLDWLLSEWIENADCGDEDFWQELLARNAWVFSQLTGAPVVLLREKAYVGGKGIENTGGGEIDFLVANALTDNVAFIEIKTPQTAISGGSYRTSGAYAMHKEISGGIVQALGYRDRFEKTYNDLRAASNSETVFQAYHGRCFVIAGTTTSLTADETRSFELFRSSLTDVQLWTFDEVATRLRGIRDALAAPQGPAG